MKACKNLVAVYITHIKSVEEVFTRKMKYSEQRLKSQTSMFDAAKLRKHFKFQGAQNNILYLN